MITIYGIRNCDTCRKAIKWLKDEGLEHRFHDFRADGLERETVAAWVREIGWETLLNRRGTTWRKLPEADRGSVDAGSAVGLMAENPTLIKRPVFDLGKSRTVGFTDDVRDAVRAAS
jgi:arsenate reductase